MSVKKVIIVFCLLIVSSAIHANQEAKNDLNNQIINEVINEKGFYDAAEVEKRSRIKELESFPNMILGDLVSEGDCGLFPCTNPMTVVGSTSDNGPTIAAIKGTIHSKGVYKNNISLKINNDKINAYEEGSGSNGTYLSSMPLN